MILALTLLATPVIVIAPGFTANKGLALEEDLDDSFGDGGTVTYDFNFRDNRPTELVSPIANYESDQIWVSRQVTTNEAAGQRSYPRYTYTALLEDGTADPSVPSFTPSVALGSLEAGLLPGPSAVVDSAGSLIIPHRVDGGFKLYRLLPSGLLDPSYSNDSSSFLFSSLPGASSNTRVRGWAIDNASRVYVSFAMDNYINDIDLIVRFDDTGQLDSTFGTSGILDMPIDGLARSFKFDQASDTFIGTYIDPSGAFGRVDRFDLTGARPAGFTPESFPQDTTIPGAIVLRNGALIVSAWNSGGRKMYLLDPTGTWLRGPGDALPSMSIAPTSDGEFFGLRPSFLTGTGESEIARFTAAGQLDTNYSDDGYIDTSRFGGSLPAAAVDRQDRLMGRHSPGSNSFALQIGVRYDGSGRLIPTTIFAEASNESFSVSISGPDAVTARLERRLLGAATATQVLEAGRLEIFDVTPDGSSVLADVDGTLTIVNPDTGSQIGLVSSRILQPAPPPQISADGSLVIFATANSLDPDDTDTAIDTYAIKRDLTVFVPRPDDDIVTATPLSDGGGFVFATPSGVFETLGIDGLQTTSQISPVDNVKWVDVSPDGRFVSWVANGTDVVVHDRDVDGDGSRDGFDDTSDIVVTAQVANSYIGAVTSPPRINIDGRLSFTKSSPAACDGVTNPVGAETGVAVLVYDLMLRSFDKITQISTTPESPGCQPTETRVYRSSNGTDRVIVASADGTTSTTRNLDATPSPTRPVTFTLSQIIGCDEELGPINTTLCPGNGPDETGETVYYAEVTVGLNDPQIIKPSERELTRDKGRTLSGDLDKGIFPRVTIPERGDFVAVNVRLFDEDGDDDDPIDINPNDNTVELRLSLNAVTGEWSILDVAGDNTHSIRGDGDTEYFSNGGHPAIVTFDISTLEPLDPAVYNNAQLGDRDGDGLLDGWELHGLDVIDITDPNPVTSLTAGTYPVLAASGPQQVVDVNVPDILVENDWVQGAPPVYNYDDGDPTATPPVPGGPTYATIVESYRLSEKTVPGALRPPINLWFDTGTLTDGNIVPGIDSTDPNGYTNSDPMFAPSAGDFGLDLGGGNEIELDTGDLAGITQVCNLVSDTTEAPDVLTDDDTTFYNVKNFNFNANRRWAFRYALNGSAAAYGLTRCGRGGRAEIGGNDILNLRGDPVVMMHELGHSVGLRHGGGNDELCKPHYQSVMNYSYDRDVGIPLDSGDYLLDYSPPRFASGTRPAVLPDLDENFIDDGPFDPTSNEHLFIFADGTAVLPLPLLGVDSVDFNGDGIVDMDQAINISANPDVNGCASDSDLEVLSDHDDWSAVSASFRAFGDYDDASIELSDDDGMTETPQEAQGQTRSLFRADVAVEASLSDGLLAISVFGLDAPRLVAPAIDVTLNDFTVDELPTDCTSTSTGFACELAGSLGSAMGSGSPTEAVEWAITLMPSPGASMSSVDMVATSNENPLDNDPDPTNNTATLTSSSGAQLPSCETADATEPCVVPQGTTINGSLTRTSDVLVLGEVTGNLKSNDGTITIGSSGVVQGNVTQNGDGDVIVESGGVVGINVKDNGPGNVVVSGSVRGNAQDNGEGDLTVAASAIVGGDAKETGSGSLFVEGEIGGRIDETADGDLTIGGSSSVAGAVKESGNGSVTVLAAIGATAQESGNGNLTIGPNASTAGSATESSNGDLNIDSASIGSDAKESGSGDASVTGSSTVAGNLASFGSGTCTVAPAVIVQGSRSGTCA